MTLAKSTSIKQVESFPAMSTSIYIYLHQSLYYVKAVLMTTYITQAIHKNLYPLSLQFLQEKQW